jgi:hypothetical protein
MAPENNDTSRGGYGLERGEWESRRRPDGSQRPASAAEQARDLRRGFMREATGAQLSSDRRDQR